jgi:glucose-1-phosphate thymidylyltransferase
MKVVIPVAGEGNRLKPHTYSLPKPLLHVAGKPVLAYILDPIMKLNPDEVIFVLGFKGEMIKEYVEHHYSFKATFVEQDRLLGLGYAIYLALDCIDNDPVLIVLGDTIVECDLEKFIHAGDSVLGLRQVEDPERFGIAEIEGGYVKAVEEKPTYPKTNLALIGLYFLRESAPLRNQLRLVMKSGQRTYGEIQLTDALQAMIKGGTRFVPHEVQGWYDCGKKETLLATNRHLLGQRPTAPEVEGSVIIPPVYIAPTARIVNCVIGPNVSISDKTLVTNSVIKNAIIGYQSRISDVILEDSLLGHDTVVQGEKKVLNIGDSSEIDYS